MGKLKTFFNSIDFFQLKIDVRYKAILIKDMWNDHKNLLCFHFTMLIVQEFERVNSIFQWKKVDPHSLHQDLSRHHKTLCTRIYDGNGSKKNIEKVDFGVKFLVQSNQYMKRMQSEDADKEIRIIKEICQSMLEEALPQV